MNYFIAVLLLATFSLPGLCLPPVDGTDPNGFYSDSFKEWLAKLLNPHFTREASQADQTLMRDPSEGQQEQEGQSVEIAEDGKDEDSNSDTQDQSLPEDDQSKESDEPSESGDEKGDEKGDQPGDESGDEKGDQPGDEPGDEKGDQPGDKPGDQPGDEPGDKPGDQPGDEPGDKPGDQPGDQEGEGEGSKPGDQPGLNPGANADQIQDYVRRKLGLKDKKSTSRKSGAQDGRASNRGAGKDGRSGGASASFGQRVRKDGDENFDTHDKDFKPKENVDLDKVNPLIAMLVQQTVRSKIDISLNSVQLSNAFLYIDSMVEFINLPTLQQAYWLIRSVYRAAIPKFPNWFKQIQALSHQDLNQSYRELQKMRRFLHAFELFWHHPQLDALAKQLGAIARDFELLNVADPDQQAAERLFKSLPSLGRSYLRRRYDFEEIGDNPGTHLLGSQIKKGELRHLELVASLISDAKFKIHLLDEADNYRSTKTWLDDESKPIGKEFLPFRHPRELPRVVRGQPGKDIEDNIIEGTAHVKKTKKRSEVASRQGKRRDPTTLTVVGLDISGSMHGGIGLYQSAFATAFVLNALSERTKAGTPAHHVVIFPFDDAVREPIWITKPKDAFNLLEDYQALLKNREGNTDISKFMLEALDLINNRARRGNISFKRANILLLTDGMSAIDTAAIKAKREAIKHPVQLFVVNLRQENAKLKQLATDKAIHFDRAYFESYSTADIKAKLQNFAKAKHSEFHANASADQLSSVTAQKIAMGIELSDDLVAEYLSSLNDCSSQDFLDFLSSIETTSKEQSEVGELALQTNAFMRTHHLFFQGERGLLDCYLVELLRYLRSEAQLKKLSLSEADIQVFREMHRLTQALANAPRVDAPATKRSSNAEAIAAWSSEAAQKVDGFGELVFSLFPGDYRKTCDECEISDTGALHCRCNKGSYFADATLEHAADCFTSIENSRGQLGCIPGGGYLERCRNCWFDEKDYLVCECDYSGSKRMEKGRGCLYAEYKGGQIVCVKRR